MKIIPYDDYNHKIPPPCHWDYIGTVVQNFGREAWKNGWKLIEIYEDNTI